MESETLVFLGGSRQVSLLNSEVLERIDTVIAKGFPIVVGDANGADKALQAYLQSKGYRNVRVYCSGGRCRNNLGRWEIEVIPTKARESTFDFYAAKDRAMAREASVGLMVWDGRSVGTLYNVFRLLRQNKRAAVYSVPDRTFRELKSASDWSQFIRQCASDVQRKFLERGDVADLSEDDAQPQLSFLG